MHVAHPIKVEVHLVSSEAVFPVALQHILEGKLAQQLRFFTTAKIDVLDLSIDVPLLVGQEEVIVAATTDKCLLFETLEAFFDLPPQGQSVRINLIEAQRDEVIDIALDLFNVPNQEKHLQELCV